MADEGENRTTDRKKQISGRDRASQTTSSTSQGDPAGNPPPTNGGDVNWGYVAAVGGGAVATGVAAVIAAPVVLSAAGFTAGGVAAGSMAAAAQSAIYGGFTGGVFSVLQSAGAAGIGLAGNAAIGATGATVGGVLSGLGARFYGSRVKTMKLLICGEGIDAHAFAGIASSRKEIEVRVLSLNQDEAERWSSALQTTSVEVEVQRRGHEPMSIKSKPALITKNPGEAMRDIDFVVFVFPASAHEDYLNALRPHIKPGMTIVGLPGGPGFEFQVRHALDETAQPCTILNFQSSPWRCRMVEFGVKYEVLLTMETLLGTMKVALIWSSQTTDSGTEPVLSVSIVTCTNLAEPSFGAVLIPPTWRYPRCRQVHWRCRKSEMISSPLRSSSKTALSNVERGFLTPLSFSQQD